MTAPDNKPTSPREILHDYAVNLHPYSNGTGQASDYDKYTDEALAAIAAYYEGLIPAKESDTLDPELYPRMTARSGGWNQAIDTIKRNFTGQTDNEREQ